MIAGGESKDEPSADSSKSADGPTAGPAPSYQSKIGNKYSTKKNSVSAFTGAARKLT